MYGEKGVEMDSALILINFEKEKISHVELG